MPGGIDVIFSQAHPCMMAGSLFLNEMMGLRNVEWETKLRLVNYLNNLKMDMIVAFFRGMTNGINNAAPGLYVHAIYKFEEAPPICGIITIFTKNRYVECVSTAAIDSFLHSQIAQNPLEVTGRFNIIDFYAYIPEKTYHEDLKVRSFYLCDLDVVH